MTEKLYYQDSHLSAFTARITGCEPAGEGYLLTLDRTAFFPEGGGQPGDSGRIGGVFVRDTQEKDGRILHYAEAPLPVGQTVECRLDREQRLRRMQNHTGEHIVSGLIHSLYGYDNVGFHMGERCMTMDYSGELTGEELERVESAANAAIRDNLPVRAWFPEETELAALPYRSKKELTGPVRIVEIPGIDRCACCAPHAAFIGEVGVIKILSAERHRGGTRLEAICGLDALDDYRRRFASTASVSRALSVPQENVTQGVERLLTEQSRLKERVAALSMELVRLRAEATPYTEGNLCVFDRSLDEIALRELVNLLMEKCAGVAAAFSGDDESGYRYILGSRHVDLRKAGRAINAAIQGKGGGTPEMIQGRAAASAASIRLYIENATF